MEYLFPLSLFFVAYAILAWRDFDLAIYLFIGLLPAYLIRFSIGPLPSTALEGMMIILILRWLWKKLRVDQNMRSTIRGLKKTTFFLPGMLLLFASTLSVLVAPDKLAALGIWKAYFIEPFLLYCILLDQFRGKEDWKKAFYALGATTILLTILAIVQRITGWWSPTWEWTLPESRRVTGLFTSPNSLGLYVAPITALYFAWNLVTPKAMKRLNQYQNIVIFSGFLAIYLAVSRGAMIGLAAAIIFVLYRFLKKRVATIAILVGVALLALLPSVRSSIVEVTTFQVASGQSRLALYEGSWKLLSQNPIQGLGLASFAQRFEEVRTDEFTEELIYPHNLFLNFWSETGLLGLIAILWMIFIIYRITQQRNAVWPILFIAGFITMLAHGMVDVPYFKNDLAMLSWIFLAGLASTQKPLVPESKNMV